MRLSASTSTMFAALLLLTSCTSDATRAREVLVAGKRLVARHALDEGAVRFGEAARLDPQLHEAFARLARTRLEQRRADDAETAARRAVSLVPRSAYYAELLARAQLLRGASDDALTSFERAITLDSTQTARLALSIGVIYERAGKAVEAQRAYERAASADPSAAAARLALARLRLRGAERTGEGAHEAYGTLMGDQIGDSFGFAAVDVVRSDHLGLTGTGRSGGSGVGTIGMQGFPMIGLGPLGHGGGQRTLASVPTLGNATVVGSLPSDLVRRIVRRHVNELRHCYEQALARDGALHGTVSLAFVIDATGAVSEATATGLGDAAVESCMAAAVRRWGFPAPDGGGSVRVTQPIELAPPPPVAN